MNATLYGDRLSPFVEKVARALQVKDIAFKLVGLKGPNDLKKWNPTTGKMPVLEIAGERLFDSSLIVRRLDEIIPEPALVSADAGAAARQRFVEDWSDESLYWYVMALRWNTANAKATAAQIGAFLPAPLRPLAGPLFNWQIGGLARAQGLARLPLDVILAELARRFDELSIMLGDDDFFFSDRVSVADLAIFGQLSTLRSGPTPQGAKLVDAQPALVRHFDRVDRATGSANARNTRSAA
jgi:glutathione S-transferase